MLIPVKQLNTVMNSILPVLKKAGLWYGCLQDV